MGSLSIMTARTSCHQLLGWARNGNRKNKTRSNHRPSGAATHGNVRTQALTGVGRDSICRCPQTKIVRIRELRPIQIFQSRRGALGFCRTDGSLDRPLRNGLALLAHRRAMRKQLLGLRRRRGPSGAGELCERHVRKAPCWSNHGGVVEPIRLSGPPTYSSQARS